MSTVSHYQNSSVRELGISETIKRCSFRQRFHEWVDAFLAGLSSHCCGTPMAGKAGVLWCKPNTLTLSHACFSSICTCLPLYHEALSRSQGYILCHRYSVSTRRVLRIVQMINALFQLALLIRIMVQCFSPLV